jgi:hypothetical protein
MAAASVELFFMLASGLSKIRFQTLRWIIFLYSAFTVCYSTYISDPKIIDFKNHEQQLLLNLNKQLNQHQFVSKSLWKQQDGLLADMEVYRKNELISVGHNKLASEKAQLKKSIELNEVKIANISSKISEITLAEINRGVFSPKNLLLIEVRTWSVMAFLILIQLLSSVCMNEFSKSLKSRTKKRKRNTHNKQETYEATHQQLAIH